MGGFDLRSRGSDEGAAVTTTYPEGVLDDVANPHFASFLDGMRWIAASIVFLGHLRDPLFLGYGSLSAAERTPAVQLWYFVTGWFGPAVIVFFVLSGYLVGGIASARASVGKFSVSSYAIDRFSRLYVAYLPALLLTLALDSAGSAWFADTGFWTHQQPMLAEKVASAPFASLLTPGLFLGNLFMLQTVALPTFGSNMPLWTISLEFWFYAVFGLAMFAMLAGSRRRRILAGLLLALAIGLLGGSFVAYLGLWLIGVACAFIPWRALERPWIAGLLFLGVLVAARLGQGAIDRIAGGIWIRDYAVALSFAWMLISMRRSRAGLLMRVGAMNKFMADFSYSLYLIHFPLMLFVLGALHATGRFDAIAVGYSPTSAQGLAVHAMAIAIIYAVAWLFARITERQTPAVRSWLKRLVARRAPAKPEAA